MQQVIDGRLMRLGEQAVQLLEVAAVIGQEVPLELWRADHELVVDVVKRAVASHLLVETTGRTALRFSHALIREAVYDRVVLPERPRLHRRIAEIRAARAQPIPDVVAYHFRRAADVRAIEWLLRAGERAQTLYAPKATIDYLTSAIALAEQHACHLP